MTTLRRITIAFGASFTLGLAAPAHAQSGNGYLFHEPEGRLTIRAGYDHANAGSDVFAQSISTLTINKADFSGLTLGAEGSIVLNSRLDLSVDVGFSHAGKASEFRNFIDNNNLPIEQTTSFDRVPLTANLRYYLTEPGRSVGKLAWIPNKIVPWIGAGGGFMWYRFRQQGDFVDFSNNNVFTATLESSDWVGMAQGMAGADISLSPRVALRADARYVYAKAQLNASSFSGFDRIDLSGVQGTLGLTFRL
jgi:outer membrane protein W